MSPTVKEALAAIRALGLPCARLSETREFRVGSGAGAYYTDDAADAIATALDMVRRNAERANAAPESPHVRRLRADADGFDRKASAASERGSDVLARHYETLAGLARNAADRLAERGAARAERR